MDTPIRGNATCKFFHRLRHSVGLPSHGGSQPPHNQPIKQLACRLEAGTAPCCPTLLPYGHPNHKATSLSCYLPTLVAPHPYGPHDADTHQPPGDGGLLQAICCTPYALAQWGPTPASDKHTAPIAILAALAQVHRRCPTSLRWKAHNNTRQHAAAHTVLPTLEVASNHSQP